MKAVELVAARPDVDATKIGASGGSYGGFMTTWMATRTRRFAAIQTDRTITDIALAVGFSTNGYFSRIFRREVGVAPDAFRRTKTPL